MDTQIVADTFRRAKRLQAAKQTIADGYTYWKDADGITAVCKPGRLAATYFIGLWKDGACECPDFEKHGDFCKHTIAAGLSEEEKQAASCEMDLHAYRVFSGGF